MPTNGAGRVAILAGVKLGISSLYILVIWRKRGKIVLAAEFLFRITFAATLVLSEHFNLKDDT